MTDFQGQVPHERPAQAAREALLEDLTVSLSEDGIRRRRRAHNRGSRSLAFAIWTAGALRLITNTVAAFLLIALLSPVLLVLLLVARIKGGGLVSQARLGRWATIFPQYEFDFGSSSLSRWSAARRMPVLFNIFKGEMSFIGPRPVPSPQLFREAPNAWKRYDLRPGLLSTWWLRQRANIAYSNELVLDLDYVETSSLRGDLGLAMRMVPALFFGGTPRNAPPQVNFLGVRIDNLTMTEACHRIADLARADSPSQVCFVNADCFNIAFANQRYRDTLAHARLVLADGIGARIAGSILNQNIRENVNGTDMFPILAQTFADAGLGVYLLGGRPGVSEGVAAWLATRYPTLRLCGQRHGYFDASEEPQVLADIRASQADVVFVAFGAPRQDDWIYAHRHELGAKVAIGVGGLFDFYSGRIKRAPLWLREISMEWLYRFLQEPRRMWRRYFVGNSIFLYRVLHERWRTSGTQSY